MTEASAGEQRPSGFLERLRASTGGVIAGACLFALSLYVLFTNEGRALRTAAALDEGLSQLVCVQSDVQPEFRNDGRLVHLTGDLRTAQPLYDPNYSVSVHAVKLQRQVEMYQWVEYSDSRDVEENGEKKTETTYSYNTEWRSEVISSRHFDQEVGHMNPSEMAVESVTVVAPEVWVGKFLLSTGLVEQISEFHTLSLSALPVPDAGFLTVQDDYYYHTPNPRRPEVGDVRVRFAYAGLSGEGLYPGSAHKVSVVAQQQHQQQLRPFSSRSGHTLELLYMGQLTAEEVFAKEHQLNSMKTWALRLAGCTLMFLSISLSTRVIHTLVERVPLLGGLLAVGLQLFCLSSSVSLSLLTIAAGWIYYRPLLALCVAAAALVLPLALAHARAPAKKRQ